MVRRFKNSAHTPEVIVHGFEMGVLLCATLEFGSILKSQSPILLIPYIGSMLYVCGLISIAFAVFNNLALRDRKY
jgi:hypothetical protein